MRPTSTPSSLFMRTRSAKRSPTRTPAPSHHLLAHLPTPHLHTSHPRTPHFRTYRSLCVHPFPPSDRGRRQGRVDDGRPHHDDGVGAAALLDRPRRPTGAHGDSRRRRRRILRNHARL